MSVAFRIGAAYDDAVCKLPGPPEAGAPPRAAVPLSSLCLMPARECENDVGDRFTIWPSGNPHGTSCLSAGAVASYASGARSVQRCTGGTDRTGSDLPGRGPSMGVACRVFSHACPALQGVAPSPRIPCGKAWLPPTRGHGASSSGRCQPNLRLAASTGQIQGSVIHKPTPAREQVLFANFLQISACY